MNPLEKERRAAFKKTVDNAANRRRREETSRQIRKNKKEETLRKRRMGQQQMKEDEAMESSSDSTSGVSLNDIQHFYQVIASPESTTEQVTEATRSFRKILSAEKFVPVDTVLATGVLPYFVKNLTADLMAYDLVFESEWALTNIASTSYTAAVVEAEAVEPLVSLLNHDAPDIREQAAWCLGNIAGDKFEFRDWILHAGAMDLLLKNVKRPQSMSLLGTVVWTISNLCRSTPKPEYALIRPALEPLCNLLSLPISKEVAIDTMWSLSYLSEGSESRIQDVIDTGVVPKLVEHLEDKTSPIIHIVVRCLGNLSSGNDAQTQAVIDAGALQHMAKLLDINAKQTRRETCWFASNIAAGTHQQIDAMIMKRNGVLRRLVSAAQDGPWEVRKEALWALSNICTVGDDSHAKTVIQNEGLEPLTACLLQGRNDKRILLACLEAIAVLLDVGERHHLNYDTMFAEYNGIAYLEELQSHNSDDVYKKALAIIETHFNGEDETLDENCAPPTTENGTFGFGGPKQLFTSPQRPTQGFSFGVSNRPIR